MKVTVKMFASFREAVGVDQSGIEIADGTTVAQLWDALVDRHPPLAPMKTVAGMAVNGRYSPPDRLLLDGDTVAFLPPVSGG